MINISLSFIARAPNYAINVVYDFNDVTKYIMEDFQSNQVVRHEDISKKHLMSM